MAACRPISEVKQRWVWLVLGWVTAAVTAWENISNLYQRKSKMCLCVCLSVYLCLCLYILSVQYLVA